MKHSVPGSLLLHKTLWVLILFSPPFFNVDQSIYAGQRYIYLFCIIPASVLVLVYWIILNQQLPKQLIPVITYCCFLSCYYLFDTLILTDHIINRDFFDVFRPFIYLIFLLFSLVIPLQNVELVKLFKFLGILIFFQIIINFLIFVPPLDEIVRIYRNQHSGSNWFRFSGTLGFSYFFAFFMSFFMFLKLFQDRFERKRNHLLLGYTYLTVILLSGSRIAYIAVLPVLFWYFLGNNILYSQVRPIIILFGLGITAVIYFLDEILEYSEYTLIIIDRFITLLDGGLTADPSARHRLKEISVVLDVLEENLWFGRGSSKYFFFEINDLHLENMYAYYLGKWGLFGFILYLLQVVFFYFRAKYVVKHTSNRLIKSISLAYIYWLTLIFLFGATTSVTDSFRSPFYFYTISGYILMLHQQTIANTKGAYERKEEVIITN